MGGAATGAVVGLAGALLTLNARVVAGTVLAALLVLAPLASPRRLPQVNRETEQSLLGRGPFLWALANGFLLGLGFTSRIGYWIFYLVPVGCFVVGSPGYGALIWGAYGFTRLGIAALLAFRMHRTPTRTGDLSRRLLALQPVVRLVSNPLTVLFALGITLWLGL